MPSPWTQASCARSVTIMMNQRELGAVGKGAAAMVLTLVGGFVDAVGYVALFQIFTANMSGNSVHIGMYLGKLEPSLARPACAVGAYVLGLIATRIVLEIGARADFSRIASCTLAAEAMLLLVFARTQPKMHLGQFTDLRSPEYFLLVATLALSMGIQAGTLTRIGALTVYTTFVTGTLTKASESFARFLFWVWDELRLTKSGVLAVFTRAAKQSDARDALFLAAVWCSYVIGAALGTAAKFRWELRALYVPIALLGVFIIIDLYRPFGVQEERYQQRKA